MSDSIQDPDLTSGWSETITEQFTGLSEDDFGATKKHRNYELMRSLIMANLLVIAIPVLWTAGICLFISTGLSLWNVYNGGLSTLPAPSVSVALFAACALCIFAFSIVHTPRNLHTVFEAGVSWAQFAFSQVVSAFAVCTSVTGLVMLVSYVERSTGILSTWQMPFELRLFDAVLVASGVFGAVLAGTFIGLAAYRWNKWVAAVISVIVLPVIALFVRVFWLESWFWLGMLAAFLCVVYAAYIWLFSGTEPRFDLHRHS